jgi:dTDP-4-dehydrorhamnose 3,5-epimerase
MNIVQTGIKDLYVLEPKVFGDHRGYFFESYNKKVFESLVGKNYDFIQDNESKSSYGVLRGLHFQAPPFAQTKLVRCILGSVLDVVVDLRNNSVTYGKHYSVLLTEENKKQLVVPTGFAHGFVVLSETAIFSYKVDQVYMPSQEQGIFWNDKDLNIDWKIESSAIILSEKDKDLINFKDFNSPFNE